MSNLVIPKIKHVNNDTKKDLIDWYSLLGFESTPESSLVRDAVFYYSIDTDGKKIQKLICVDGVFLTSGKQNVSGMNYVRDYSAPAMVVEGSYGSDIAVANECDRALKILTSKDGTMIKYLATAPETPDDAVKAIKNLPKTLEDMTFNGGRCIKEGICLKDLISATRVLTRNPQYRKVYEKCLEKNMNVYFGNMEDSLDDVQVMRKK